jgi:hypothetical protein
MSEARTQTDAAQKRLVAAVWDCIVDASSMNVVLSGPEFNAALRDFRAAIEAEARAAALAGREALVRRIEALPLYDPADRITAMNGTVRPVTTLADAAEAMQRRVLAALAETPEETR